MIRNWTTDDVHEALLRWGAMTVRMQDGGLGHAGQVAWAAERVSAPYRALDPSEFTDDEFAAVDRAVSQLEPVLKVVVLCYYKPGHLRSKALEEGRPLGKDGKGRERSPAIRVIAGYLSIGKDIVDRRLSAARVSIAYVLTNEMQSDRIGVTV